MSSNLVEEILNGLKEQLDKNNQLLVQANEGYCYTATFTFNDPATIEEIDQFAKNTGWVIPSDYKDFLLLHNGANLFEGEYEGVIELFKIGEILSHHSDMMPNDSYPIGYYPDVGCIMVDSKRCKKGEKNYLWLFGIDRMDLKCDFKTWLDRMIMAQGNNYWEWFR